MKKSVRKKGTGQGCGTAGLGMVGKRYMEKTSISIDLAVGRRIKTFISWQQQLLEDCVGALCLNEARCVHV